MDLRQRFALWQIGHYKKKRDKATQRWLSSEEKRDKATQRWLSSRQRYLSLWGQRDDLEAYDWASEESADELEPWIVTVWEREPWRDIDDDRPPLRRPKEGWPLQVTLDVKTIDHDGLPTHAGRYLPPADARELAAALIAAADQIEPST